MVLEDKSKQKEAALALGMDRKRDEMKALESLK